MAQSIVICSKCCVFGQPWGGVIGAFLATGKHSFFYIGQSLLCLPFYAIGYWCSDWLKNPSFRPNMAFYSLGVWLCLTFAHDSPQNISLNWINKDMVSFYIDALSGSIFVVEMCKLIKGRILLYIGKNSLIIMMVHFLFMHINYQILHIRINSVWIWLTFVVSWIFLSIAMIPLFRNKWYKLI